MGRKKKRKHKARNYDFKVAMMELARSSATSPVPSGKKYKRRNKHRNRDVE